MQWLSLISCHLLSYAKLGSGLVVHLLSCICMPGLTFLPACLELDAFEGLFSEFPLLRYCIVQQLRASSSAFSTREL